MRGFTHRVLITGKRCGLGFFVDYVLDRAYVKIIIYEATYSGDGDM